MSPSSSSSAITVLLLVLLVSLTVFCALPVAQAQDAGEFDDDEFEVYEAVPAAAPYQPQAATEDEFDDLDEFEGGAPTINTAPSPAAAPAATPLKPPSNKGRKKASGPRRTWFSWIPMPPPFKGWEMETVLTAFLILFAVNTYIGSRTNKFIALEFGKAVAETISADFAKVGKQEMMIPESYHGFRIVATGRRNCFGMDAELQLTKRQELISWLWNYARGTQVPDLLTIDVAMEKISPLAFALASRTVSGSIRGEDEYKDLKNFCQQTREAPADLSASHVVFSDSMEVLQFCLPKQLLKQVVAVKKYLRLIHITSTSSRNTSYQQTLRFIFRIPPEGQMDIVNDFFKLVFAYIDYVPTIKLSALAEKKAVEKRQNLQKKLRNTDEAREERLAAQDAAYEEKMKKRRLRLAAMTPEQRAKEEKRIKKKDQRKQSGKMKVVLG